MRAILSARKVDHTINAGERGSSAAISMRVELLLGQDVAAVLRIVQQSIRGDLKREAEASYWTSKNGRK